MTTTVNNNVKHRQNVSARSRSSSPTSQTTSPPAGSRLYLVQLSFIFSALITLVVLCFMAYQAIVYDVRATDNDRDDVDLRHTNEVLPGLFLPFSSDVLQLGHVYFEIDMNATLAGREIRHPRLPILISVSVGYGTLFISDDKQPLLAVAVSAYKHGYDKIGGDSEQKFYFRQVTADQHLAYTCCLLNERQVRSVFSLTWVNITYDKGKPAGDFQCLVAFIDESTIYLLRTYSSGVLDLNEGQFSMFDYVSKQSYDVGLKASDVIGKRVVHKISEKPHGKSFPRVEVNPNCHT